MAQDKISVVTLNNGTVLKGTIKAIDPTDALTIVIAGIETYVKMENVAKIEEDKEFNQVSEPSSNNDLQYNDNLDNPEPFVALTKNGRFCFKILSKTNKTVEVTYTKNVKYTESHYVIPSTVEYNGEKYTVVAIGEDAFNENKRIETLELPNTIKRIGDKAFEQCKHLTKIVFPEGLEYIGEKAFSQCPHLTEVILPSGLIEIGEKAFFYDLKLSKVELPNTLKVINKQAFAFCLGMKEITLPVGLERIDDLAFFTTKIERIDIPNTVKFIGVKAFLSGTTFIGQESIIKWVSIPESVIEIGKGAFCKFQNLMGNTRSSKCHIELLPSWVNEEEAKRIGLSEDSFEQYVNSKK